LVTNPRHITGMYATNAAGEIQEKEKKKKFLFVFFFFFF
jgi:hypothetical protein